MSIAARPIRRGQSAARWGAWAVVAAVSMTVISGCGSAPTSTPPSSSTAHAPVFIVGDVAVVRLGQALTATFGDLPMTGRRTPDAVGDHARGLALDVMVPQWNTPAGIARGDAITAWVQSHSAQYRVRYTLWRQQYQAVGDQPAPMGDRGNPTANNLDHVHITVNAPGPRT